MEPITRGEMFLAAAAGEYDGELPDALTRHEHYLEKIKEAIENGSSVAPEDIDAAIESYLNSHDADIVTEAELTQALAGKAAASHSHAQGDVTGLADALAGKAAASHTHAQADVTGLADALAGKAAASHSHAQADVTGLADALAGKAAASHSHDDRYYTESEIDTALSGKSNTGHLHDDRYYTETEMDTALAGKADSTDIPDVSDFITRTVNDLTNYYTKSQTYTQTEIDNMVSAIPKFAIQVVNALPVQDISPTTVYLLTVQNGQQSNMYDEYIHVGNNWELLGTQTVDLSGYYTSAQVDALLSGLPVAGHTHDDRYYTETEIDGKIQTINTAIAGKAAGDHTHDDRYYTETEIDTALSGKSNTGHSHDDRYYTETEIDTALSGKAAASHTHAQSDITDLATALSGKADATATQTALNSKADATATQTALAGKQNALTAGANITIETVNDALTISATDTTYLAATALADGLMSAVDFKKINPQVIVANTDLNGITVDGWYYCGANTIAATLSNCPTNHAFYLEVHKHAGRYQHIVEYDTNCAAQFHRNLYSGTWGNWVQWKLTDTTYSAGTGLSLSGTTFSNAAPNVKSDWNAAAGTDAEILNKPTIPNYSNATPSTNGVGGSNGLMSAADKEKLDKIVVISQSDYEALDPPDSGTIYLILEAVS